MGAGNLKRCAETENIVALCDVDRKLRGQDLRAASQGARSTRDYREMLDKQKDIDAVIVATPDHTHAVIAMAAIARGQARLRAEAADPFGVRGAGADRGGPQAQGRDPDGQPGPLGRRRAAVCEWIAGGAIGPVREVHAWTNRPVWPQGVEVGRPATRRRFPTGSTGTCGSAPRRSPVPSHLPPGNVAGVVGFRHRLARRPGLPHSGRRVFWALKLKYPTSVEGCISTYWEEFWKKTEPKNETYPALDASCATSSRRARTCRRSSSPGGTAG